MRIYGSEAVKIHGLFRRQAKTHVGSTIDLDAACCVSRVSDGDEHPRRQWDAVQVRVPDEWIRIACGGIDARAGTWWDPPSAEPQAVRRD